MAKAPNCSRVTGVAHNNVSEYVNRPDAGVELARGGKDVAEEGQAYKPPSSRRIFRQGRCPGCHGTVTLTYEMVKVYDSYRYKLLSSKPDHSLCRAELEDIRRLSPIAFRRAIAGKGRMFNP